MLKEKKIIVVNGITCYIGYSDAEYRQLIIEEYRHKLSHLPSGKKLVCRGQWMTKGIYRDCGNTLFWPIAGEYICCECLTPVKEEIELKL